MMFRIDRFFLDEKDLFVGLFALLLLFSFFLGFPLDPFRRETLVVMLLFLIITRSLVSPFTLTGYILLVFIGLLFSLFLSPYGVAIYLFIAFTAYRAIVR